MDRIFTAMLVFQRRRKITKQCVTNTQYLYDCIGASFGYGIATTVPCIVIATNTANKTLELITHLVIKVPGGWLDPSYEVFSKPEKTYCFTVKEFEDVIKKSSIQPSRRLCSTTKKTFLQLRDIAEKMNGGELVVADKTFYNEQADFVAATHKRFPA